MPQEKQKVPENEAMFGHVSSIEPASSRSSQKRRNRVQSAGHRAVCDARGRNHPLVLGMAPSSANSAAPTASACADRLPSLRLELRHGSAPPIPHDVASVSFLVGTVPGCDLRLPGAALPAVCCLLTRRP